MSDYKEKGIHYTLEGVHKESKETLESIADWTNTSFPFSKKDKLNRFGILGILGYIFLLDLLESNIIEIGTGESSIYLTEIARRLKRKIFYCDEAHGKIFNPLTVDSYLLEDTILLREGTTFPDYSKNNGVAYHGRSDNFFKELTFPPIGLGFIDGEHHYEYVKRDFDNIFKLLVPNGVIFLHDTYPSREELVLGDYCSTAYKMRQELECRNDVDVFTFPKTVGVGVGITMVRKLPDNLPYYQKRGLK
jgi:hypothetical protein